VIVKPYAYYCSGFALAAHESLLVRDCSAHLLDVSNSPFANILPMLVSELEQGQVIANHSLLFPTAYVQLRCLGFHGFTGLKRSEAELSVWVVIFGDKRRSIAESDFVADSSQRDYHKENT
jgi:hypothetical protein